MANAPTLATDATESQALAYLNQQYGSYKYANSQSTPYNGMTAAQIYAYVAAKNPSATPYDIAVAVADLMLSSGIAAGLGQGIDTGATALGDTLTGVQTASILPSWASGLTNLLGALGQASTWERVAEVLIGAALVITGVAHLFNIKLPAVVPV